MTRYLHDTCKHIWEYHKGTPLGDKMYVMAQRRENKSAIRGASVVAKGAFRLVCVQVEREKGMWVLAREAAASLRRHSSMKDPCRRTRSNVKENGKWRVITGRRRCVDKI